MKVQEHSIINFNQFFNNKYKNIENQEKFEDLDFDAINRKFYQNNENKYYNPLMAYYNINNEYLIKKYIDNYNEINIEKSNNYIRKDSFNQNEQNNTNYDESIEENQQILNEISFNKNELTNNYNQIGNNDIYNQNNFYQGNNNQQNITNNIFNNINFINTLQKPNFNSMNMINNNNFLRIFNNNNNNMNRNNNNNNQKNIEMFGKKGWICVYCSNFNYEGRNKCNRCKNNKSPKNIYKQNSNNEINEKNLVKNNFSNSILHNNNKQKQFSERLGDWICFNCKNLNFSFRKFCNRCQLSKEESNNSFIQFILYNNNKLIQNNSFITNNNSVNQKNVIDNIVNNHIHEE